MTTAADRSVQGIWPMLYAFFDAEGRIDPALMQRQIDACVLGGAHGLACLGLASEVAKLSTDERRALLELVATHLAGRLPLAVTVAESSVMGQIDMAKAATGLGATFVILQPPPVPGLAEIEFLRFFGKVADRCSIPVAIQNAAAYIGIGLSADGLLTLSRNHQNITILKAEGTAVEVAALVERTGGLFAVFNGRGGLELPDNLRAGCAGMIPSPDCLERQATLFAAFAAGDETTAEAIYQEIAPAIGFVMQSIPHLVAYGKRLTANRLGLAPGQVHDRAPAMTPTTFGVAAARRFAAALGPLPRG